MCVTPMRHSLADSDRVSQRALHMRTDPKLKRPRIDMLIMRLVRRTVDFSASVCTKTVPLRMPLSPEVPGTVKLVRLGLEGPALGVEGDELEGRRGTGGASEDWPSAAAVSYTRTLNRSLYPTPKKRESLCARLRLAENCALPEGLFIPGVN